MSTEMVRPDIAFVDVETGGLDHKKHGIVEIAVIVVDGTTLKDKDQYVRKVWPEKPVTPEAAKINGFSVEGWFNATRLKYALHRVFELLHGTRWVGSKPQFDWDFLEQAARDLSLGYMPQLADRRLVNICDMAEPWIFHGLASKGGLDAIGEAFGLPPRGIHSALDDCYRARDIYKRIVETTGEVIKPVSIPF